MRLEEKQQICMALEFIKGYVETDDKENALVHIDSLMEDVNNSGDKFEYKGGIGKCI